MKFYKFILLFFLCNGSLCAQKDTCFLEFWSIITKSDKPLAKVTIELFKENQLQKNIVNSNDGTFVMKIPIIDSTSYILRVSKDQYISKSIEINTSNVKNCKENKIKLKLGGGISLYKPLIGVDYTQFQKPIVLITYDTIKGKFDITSTELNKSINNLKKVYDNEKKVATIQDSLKDLEIEKNSLLLKVNQLEIGRLNYESTQKQNEIIKKQNDLVNSQLEIKRKENEYLKLSEQKRKDDIDLLRNKNELILKELEDQRKQKEIFELNESAKYQAFKLEKQKVELDKKSIDAQRKEQEISMLNKDKQLNENELSKQKIVRNSLIFGAIGLLIVAFLIFQNLQKNKKQNKLITEQKSTLEHQKQEITDSINYSKRIQTAILPDLNDIKQSLTDFFILYQPKDIVSGDFYYFNKVNNDVFMAAADCTGHGVPGAFMSLVGSKELKIANAMTNSPAQILKHLNNGVKDTLRQNHIDGTKDGMDIALVRINGTTVRYSAANRPLWILKKDSNVIEEIKATKTAIAGFTEDDFEFEEHEINLAKGDTIYLFSDGYADQFGGDKQKKMTTKRFREFVLSIKDKSMHEQQLELQSFFNSWQGNTEQVDDLLVIGIRI